MPGEALILGLSAILMFVGLSSVAIALWRRRADVRVLFWFGIFAATYGFRLLIEAAERQPGVSDAANQSLLNARLVISYFILILALLFWRELTTGTLKRFLEWMMVPVAANAVVGTLFVVMGRERLLFDRLSSVFALVIVTVFIIVSLNPRLSMRYLVVSGKVIAFGSLLFAVIVFYVNLGNFFAWPFFAWLEPVAFTIFVMTLGYVAAEKVFANERRLLSIENELEIARGIQNSILPEKLPELERAHVAAAYRPMTSVAGDFYDFIVVDRQRAGFLVADVSGHGVPAALIASMIKVAVHSVSDCADDPAEVLRRLNQILTPQLRGQFVTAAYLWFDGERRTARYSAAGHPPLLWWQGTTGMVQMVDSNGLLFGVVPDAEYPVREFDLSKGDRLLLYTDGLIEPENSKSEAFGDAKLQQVVSEDSQLPVSDLCEKLLSELRDWQPQSVSQQDDITLVAIDVL